jgi:TonB-dependent receptor
MRKGKSIIRNICYSVVAVSFFYFASYANGDAQQASSASTQLETERWVESQIDVPSFPETRYLSMWISLKLTDVPLGRALEKVASIAGVDFSYSESANVMGKKVSVDVEHATLAETLNRMFNGTGLHWIGLEGGHIVIVEKGGDNPTGSGDVKGRVFDAETREALPGATVLVKGTSIGASTDLNGNFVIHNVPSGAQVLVVSYVGYQSQSVVVTVGEGQGVAKDIYLSPTAIQGKPVVVTAQAQGQLGAINQQLSSNTIENVVSAARIQELPDVNAAESIGRLPGVSIERSGGEARMVEINGLSPAYNLVTINGVRVPGTGSYDRSVDLSLIPSNMLSGIVLKKVITPDMDADVIGGTVDLNLKEAPEGFHIDASGLGGYNALQKYYGNYNFEGSVSDRLYNDRFGIIANLHADNYDRSADKFQDNYFEVATGGQQGLVQSVTGELLLREEKVNQKRAGGSLLLDYVIPNGKILADGFYNQLTWSGLYHINDMWTPAAPYNTNRHYYQLEQTGGTTRIFTGQVSSRQDFSWIQYDASLSFSATRNSTPDDKIWQFDQESVAFPGGSVTPTTPPTAIPGMALIDTNQTWLANVYRYTYKVNDNQSVAQLNLSVPYSLTNSVSGVLKAGTKFRWVNRGNDQNQYGYNGLQYGNGSGPNPALTFVNATFPQLKVDSLVKLYGGLPISPFLLSYSRSNFLHGDYPLGFAINDGPMNEILNALSNSQYWYTYSIGTLGQDYTGHEDYQAAYMMTELNIGSFLTFIPGVRWEGEHTIYHGESYRQVSLNNQEGPPLDLTYLTTTRTNSFWLPMINLILSPTDWLRVILARTQTISRPAYMQYAPITYITSDQSYISAANSDLKTAQATNYDASLSVYNNTIGLFSLEGFYKKIDDLIFWSTFKLSPGVTIPPGLNIPPSWYKGAAPQVGTYFNNPNPATYYGYSVEWQTTFWYLPSFLRGLVFDINYTHIYSGMDLQYDSLISKTAGFPPRITYSLVQASVHTRMPGQPANILNLTLGYDLKGFSVRVSYLYQDNKLSSIGYAGLYPSTVLSSYTGAYKRWDITAKQKVTNMISIFADFTNLNNEPDRTFVGSDLTKPSYIEYYGFAMDLGLRFSL